MDIFIPRRGKMTDGARNGEPYEQLIGLAV